MTSFASKFLRLSLLGSMCLPFLFQRVSGEPDHPPNLLENSPIGIAFVFAEKAQTVSIETSEIKPGPIQARLFQQASKIAAPVSPPFVINFEESGTTQVALDFPKKDRLSIYYLVINTKPRRFIKINCLPTKSLENLRKTSKTTPILANSSAKLEEALKFLELKYSYELSSSLKSRYQIFDGTMPLADLLSKRDSKTLRVLVFDPKLLAGQEIWKSPEPGIWQVHLPPSSLSLKDIQKKTIQAKLIYYLLADPLSPN